MKNKVLSIIIPVYNVEKYLPECMERLIPQLNDSCEVILVNDGSTDNSAVLCSNYCKSYNNFVFIEQDNVGLSGARNTGINAASGKYLLFLDSDDYLANGAIDQISAAILEGDSDVIFIRAKSFIDGSEKYVEEQVDYSRINNDRAPIDIFKELNSIDSYWFAAWLFIPKRSLVIQNNAFFKIGLLHEDELWVPVMLSYASSATLINSCVYCYRVNRSGSIIQQKNIKKQLDLFVVAEELYERGSNSNNNIKDIFLERCASIEWGRILDYQKFEQIDDDLILLRIIENNLYMLKKGKYYPLYLIIKIIGVKKASLLFKRHG